MLRLVGQQCCERVQLLCTVLIFGHSFVRRLSSDLRSNFDARGAEFSDLLGDASINLHGVGGYGLPSPPKIL